MAKNNISATFSLSTEDVQWPEIKRDEPNNLVVMETKEENKQVVKNVSSENIENLSKDNTAENKTEKDPLLEGLKEIISADDREVGTIDEDITSQLGLSSDDGQKVPTESQMQTLKTNLNSFFLMNIFESIYTQDKASQSISNFANRVNSISSAFGYSYRASADLSSIKSTVQSLKGQLEKDRYISPSYILQLEKVSRWCDELQNPSKSDWESLKSDLPANLRLM